MVTAETRIITAHDLSVFQAMAEAMMTDTCRITVEVAAVGKGTFNESTGQYDTPPGRRKTIYEGKCRFQVKADINSNVVETTAGDREWTYLTSQLQLPVEGTGHIPIDATAECLTSEHDESLPGRLFNIQGTYHKSQPVIRRFRTREVVA
jgi:hypothetical protein